MPRSLPPALAGPFWIVCSSLLFAAGWTFIKLAGADIHPFAVVFWRCLIGALLLSPFVLSGHVKMPLGRMGGHIGRATSGIIAMFCTFYALANAPIATVQAITFAAPVFATVGAVLFLGEKVRMRRVAALGIGFAGVMVVLQPWSQPLTIGVSVAVIAALAMAVTTIAIKKLVGFDRPMTVVAWSFVLPILPSLFAASFVWTWPQPRTWLYLLGIGIFTLAGQSAMVRAFSLAEASAIMPYDFVRFGFILAIGVTLFGEALSPAVLIGGGIILASAIYLAYREAQLARTTGPASAKPLI
ncbi:DMT family transporter [Pacificimonas sp. WHA3]|uniref:DMT family transporter n=1 Tax=Pacificimonas pallii TaxID=2827236 RepID=A0ABS6SGH5_9SPHN|nr:DMT family transporter [Pacificimonas pallii]MBV7257528.1 DMT family transporter [Pacificimonas pallii]